MTSFKGRYLEQVLTSIESVSNEVCNEAGVVEEYHEIATEALMKKQRSLGTNLL